MTDLSTVDIQFRGRPWTLQKKYNLGGSHRSLLPDETLAKIRPYFKQIGLTRLGNVTGLDRVGIPVTVAIRPNSYSLSQSSGKGVTLEAALVSGAMESIELYCAENIQLERIHASYNALSTDYPMMAVDDLYLSIHSLFDVDTPEEWLLAWDMIQQEEVPVPYHSVSVDFRVLNDPLCRASFTMDSNGLASGNHFLEALLSALYEVIERDSVSCHSEAFRYGHRKKTIDADAIADDVLADMLDRLRACDLQPVVFDCTTDTQVPVFEVYLYDERSNAVPISHGYGAHLNPVTAIIRALTEAVQARTLLISGARDDLFKDIYRSNRLRYRAGVEKLESHLNPVPLAHDDRSRETFEADVALLFDNLQAVGLDRVLVVDLSPPDMDIAVVSVTIPGAEGYYYYGYNPRSRAKEFVRQQGLQPASSDSLPARKDSTHLPAGRI